MDTQNVTADAAFERLEALYAQLPAMEELSEHLVWATSAASIAAAADHAAAQKALLEQTEQREKEARMQLKEAEAAGAAEAELDALRREAVYAGSLKGFRVGAARTSQRELEELVAASPFSSTEEAQAACLPKEEIRQLKERIETYQQAYEEALRVCQGFAE